MKIATPRNICFFIALLILTTATLPAKPVFADPLDFPVSDGHFYAEANGAGGAGGAGFVISNAGGRPFWSAFQELGGVSRLGYPASQRFIWNGLPTQITQRAVLQWNGTQIVLANVLDDLHDAGKDTWLQLHWLTPPPASTRPDHSLSWTAIVQRHVRFLQSSPALWRAYTSVPDPLQQLGLPMSPVIDEGTLLAVRCQRAVLQLWLTNEPWAAAGEEVRCVC
ncbi:MAG: hypothetical protein M1118_11105 [Chloroflexi bacterium]|nr:hypothetical protein [Chloroflexota bacterium]